MPMPAQLEIKRHFTELSEKEAADVVEAVADVIVDFLKNRAQRTEAKQEHAHARGSEPSTDAR